MIQFNRERRHRSHMPGDEERSCDDQCELQTTFGKCERYRKQDAGSDRVDRGNTKPVAHVASTQAIRNKPAERYTKTADKNKKTRFQSSLLRLQAIKAIHVAWDPRYDRSRSKELKSTADVRVDCRGNSQRSPDDLAPAHLPFFSRLAFGKSYRFVVTHQQRVEQCEQ